MSPFSCHVSKPLLTEFGIHHRLEGCAYKRPCKIVQENCVFQFLGSKLGTEDVLAETLKSNPSLSPIVAISDILADVQV